LSNSQEKRGTQLFHPWWRKFLFQAANNIEKSFCNAFEKFFSERRANKGDAIGEMDLIHPECGFIIPIEVFF